MKANQKFKLLVSSLKEIYSEREARNIAIYVFREIFNINKTDLFLAESPELTQSDEKKFEEILKQLMTAKPVQYINNECTFLDLKLKISSDVLIPRPETEELVMLAVNSLFENNPKILDIGTGSGCIAIALKKLIPSSELTAIDVSQKALDIAKLNAGLNKVEINFIKLDMNDLRQLKINEKMDCIISNPPYVSKEDKEFMHKNVSGFEPEIALFAPDNDTLFFYKSILNSVPFILKKGGKIFFEINEKMAVEISNLLKQKGFTTVKIVRDLHSKERFVTGIFEKNY